MRFPDHHVCVRDLTQPLCRRAVELFDSVEGALEFMSHNGFDLAQAEYLELLESRYLSDEVKVRPYGRSGIRCLDDQ